MNRAVDMPRHEAPTARDEDEARRFNPPGRTALVYRAGTYPTFLQRMLDLAHQVTIPDGPNRGKQPLANLNTGAERDWVVSILKAWAMVGDVLTFYQERIANEGFLHTATEQRSVMELVQQIGYHVRPGVAASTFLAFTVLDGRGAPERLTVPAGTAVQSVPSAGMLPVTFETSADAEARPVWNALTPYVPTVSRPPSLGPGATEVRIARVRPGLQPGTSLLILGDAPSNQSTTPSWYLRVVRKVEASRAEGATRLIWNEPLEGSTPLTNPSVLLIRQQATLFGHDAPSWKDLPTATKEKYATREGGLLRSTDRGSSWQPANRGLPEATVQALVVDGQGQIFAGAPSGVFRSTDDGQSWQSASPAAMKNVLCLALDVDGYVLAGTSSGEVFRSVDGGANWNSLRGGVLLEKGGLRFQPVNARFPKTVVRALAAVDVGDGRRDLFAGTDKGIVRSTDGGSSWQAANQGIPGRDSATGLAGVVVHALLVDSSGAIFAGTDHGVFVSRDRGDNWRAANNGLPEPAEPSPSFFRWLLERIRSLFHSAPPAPPPRSAVVYALAAYVDPGDQHRHLLAGTDRGTFASSDQGESWTAVGAGLPSGSTIRAIVVSVDSATGTPHLFAGTDAGVFRSDDRGASWSRAVAGDVQAMALGAGRLWAATPPAGFAETEWPHFGIEGGSIELDRAYPHVLKGSWLVLQQGQPRPLVGLFPVVDVATVSRADFSLNATVTRVTTTPDPTLTRFDLRETTALVWTDPLDLYAATTRRFVPVQGTTIDLDGVVADLNGGRDVCVVGKRTRARLIADLGGVLRLDVASWEMVGLAGRSVQALAFDSQHRLIAGTARGVFRHDGSTWENLGLTDRSIATLAVTPTDGILAGTPNGLYLLAGATWESAGPTGQAVQALAVDSSGILRVGTPNGLARFGATGPSEVDLPDQDILSLLIDSKGNLYAGTRDGVFVEGQAENAGWSSLGPRSREVSAMAFDRTGRLVVGTPDGVFRLDGAAWSPLGLRGQPVAAMAFDARGNLYVGTRGAGLWLVSASDGAWTIVPVGASNDVRAIAFDRTGAIQVGTGDAAILTATDGLTRLPWTRDALFSLSLARQSDLDLGVLSDAVRADFADQGVTLASAASIVVVQSGRVWLLRDDQDVAYLIRRGASELSVSSSPALAVLGMPRPFPGQPTWRTWTLRNEAGWEGTIAASADDLFQDGAGPADPSIGEIARILASEVSANQEYTTLTLAAPLRESYDPSTTTLSANVAPATHGETVPQEVLGSGNASQANQHFTLKKPPLTYVPAATPSGSADTLTIRVQPTVTRPLVPVPGVIETAALTDGIFWREVPSLYTAGPRDRVYMVRFDDEGRPTVTFGDGERGARLPTGTENVVATYRSGLGPTGNLDANRLTTPRSRPPGVRKVTNPVPATGGELPEGMDEARTRAPLTIRTFGRIVSPRDYEDFVRSFAGVSKARVRVLRSGGEELIHVTLATEDGRPLDPGSGLYRSLVQAIEEYRVPGPPVRVDSYEPVYFDLAAAVLVEVDRVADAVVAAVVETLTEAFSFARRDLGAGLTASDVVALIQGISGVTAVRLEALYPIGWRREVNPVLTAEPARWERGQVVPDQLLLLNASNGLQIRAEKGR